MGAALRILIPSMMDTAGYFDSHIGYAMSLMAPGAVVGVMLCCKIAHEYNTQPNDLLTLWNRTVSAVSMYQ
jgi:hypothetical protein